MKRDPFCLGNILMRLFGLQRAEVWVYKPKGVPIGQHLVDREVITRDQLEKALQHQDMARMPLRKLAAAHKQAVDELSAEVRGQS